jgi:hypothetical protein
VPTEDRNHYIEQSLLQEVVMRCAIQWLAAMLILVGIVSAETITLKDGTKHTGVLVGATARSISLREGSTVHRYLKSKLQSIDFDTETAEPQSTSKRLGSNTREATLPAGTEITVMPNEEIDSATAKVGQTFPADVAENVTDEAGQSVIPKGSEAELVIRQVSSAGTVRGSSDLALDLQSIKVGGRRYVVSTEDMEEKGKEGVGANKRTGEYAGGGALLGTLIGAVAGGGKGAAIGAATGAAAGAGTQVLTRGKTVKVPAESKLRFKLDRALHLRAAY